MSKVKKSRPTHRKVAVRRRPARQRTSRVIAASAAEAIDLNALAAKLPESVRANITKAVAVLLTDHEQQMAAIDDETDGDL